MKLGLILFGWFIYYAIWIILARKVNLTKLTNPLPFREGFVWFISWLFVFILLILFKNVDWKTHYFYVIGFYISFCFALYTRYQLGENWKPFATEESDCRMITNGMYKYLRHPLYFWQFFMALFTAINFQKFVPALMFVIVPTVANRLRAQSERDVLLNKYPVEYPVYRRNTFWGIIFHVIDRSKFS